MDPHGGNEQKTKERKRLGKQETSESLPHSLRTILSPDPAPEFLHKRPSLEWPASQVFENGEALWILMDLPGVERERIQISLQGSLLVVEGERKCTAMPEDAFCKLNERFPHLFRRHFELGAGFQTKKIKAVMELGILRIEIPKEQGLSNCISMSHFKRSRRPH